MNPNKILKDAIKKHNLSTLLSMPNRQTEEVLALIRYTSHIAYNEAHKCETGIVLKKTKKYYSENVNGNHHDVVIWMNENHPNGDIVDIQPVNSSLRVVVWRE